jgi:hypothetical protein
MEEFSMKRHISVLLAALLVLTIAGQAAAYFEKGHLIRVVYDKAGSGVEVATDLGDISSWTTSGIAASTPLSLLVGKDAEFTLAQFAGKSWADLNVEYYAYTTTANKSWTSGSLSGQTAKGSTGFSAYSSAGTSESTYYNGLAQDVGTTTVLGQSATVIGIGTNNNSHWKKMDGSGLQVGGFAGFIADKSGEVNLADLASTGYVDQALYFYPNPAAVGVAGAQVAILRTLADGTTLINAVATNPVPVPAAAWLLGTGIVALVGIRRRNS